jgi:hypothetical protein
VKDVDLADILFLDRHPGFSYDALMNTPDDIVAGIKLLDAERAKRKPTDA